jgi:hypothetical protein
MISKALEHVLGISSPSKKKAPKRHENALYNLHGKPFTSVDVLEALLYVREAEHYPMAVTQSNRGVKTNEGIQSNADSVLGAYVSPSGGKGSTFSKVEAAL